MTGFRHCVTDQAELFGMHIVAGDNYKFKSLIVGRILEPPNTERLSIVKLVLIETEQTLTIRSGRILLY